MKRLSGDLVSHAESSAAAALRWEERSKQAGESCKISGLNKDLAGSGKLGDHSFAAQEAAEETARCFAKAVLHVTFPRDKVTGVDNILLTGSERLPMDRSERRYQQKTRSADLQDEEPFPTEE